MYDEVYMDVDIYYQKTILLVEDQEFVALMEKEQLEEKGYTVIHAVSGEEAVEAALEPDSAIDIILMDIDLGPGIDGTEAATRILEQRDIPIIFLSSHTDPAIVKKTEKITSYGYVVKSSGIFVLDASIKMAFKLFDSKMQSRKTEEELYLQSLVLDQISDHVTITDLNGVITYVNMSEIKTIGRTREEIIGQKTDVYGEDPSRGASQSDIFQKTMANGSWRGEVVNYDKEGNEHIMDCRTQIIYDDDGASIALCGIATNITERKQSEETLKINMSNFEDTLRSLNEGVIQIDEDFIIRVSNTAFADMFGLQNNSLQGSHCYKAIHGRETVCPGCRVKEYFLGNIQPAEGEPIIHEERLISDDLFLDRSVYPVLRNENELKSVIVVVLDITEMKRNEHKYRMTFDMLPYPAHIIDDSFKVHLANRVLLEAKGLDMDSIRGDYCYKVYQDRDTLCEDCASKEVFRTSKQYSIVKSLTLSSGQEKHHEVHAFPIGYKNDRVSHVLESTIDITNQKLFEEAYSEKMVLLKELQHRVKNSFMIIESMIGIRETSVTSDETKESLHDLRLRVAALADMYTLLYESESPDVVNLRDYCERILQSLTGAVHHIYVQTDCDSIMIATRYASIIGLLITEIITNVIKHAFPDEKNGVLHVSLKEHEEGALLTIKDNGIGFPEGVNISESNTMGLSLIKRMVKQINGTVSFQCNEGTTCTIGIPNITHCG